VPSPPLLEPRLQRRYQKLVQEHLAVTDAVAPGLRALPGAALAFASTQAAWRFYGNERVSLVQLAQPLLAGARTAVAEACDAYALVMHDWSQLHYNGHPSKRDRVPLSQTTDLGYELQSALVVSDRAGEPLAPVFQGLRAADGVHSSQSGQVEPPLSQLDALAPVMAFVEQLGWDKPRVHIADAEADSVAHYRHWHRQGYLWLVRADGANHVQHEGGTRSLEQVRQCLRRRHAFRDTRAVLYKGQPAQQWVAETTVTLTRPAKLQRHGRKGPRTILHGEALTLRLVIAEVRDRHGKVRACWFLLTNLPAGVTDDTVALWYYWRWRIESYFKLVKSAGHHLEHWQQETAAAIARRLLVAAMACVLVWKIARSTAPEAEPLRIFLVRLSGRQIGRGETFTEPALLAGLWVYLAMLDALEHYDLQEMKGSVAKIFGGPCEPDTG
jgi:Transposase DDE domain